MTKLSDKAAKVDFSDLDAVAPSTGQGAAGSTGAGVAPAAGHRPRTAVAAITDRINLKHEVDELQGKVRELEAAPVVLQLDPSRIRESRWKNRNELSFSTKAFVLLRQEIETAGGNVQPIKVRRAGQGADGHDEYEIVYGRRRRRACLELGFKVNAIVEDLSDVELFTQMERENRSRADLSPWEQGVMYQDALDSELFASQRQMASALGIDQGNISRALALASLPPEVVGAFASPLDLQYRWAAEIKQALDRDPAGVLTSARELAALETKLPAKMVLAKLTATPDGSTTQRAKPHVQALTAGDKTVGSFSRDAKGGVNIALKPGALTPSEEKKLLEFVARLLH